MSTNEELRARAQAILDAMMVARRHLTTARVARAVCQPFEPTRRDLERLDKCGLVIKQKESDAAATWKHSDHVIACPCRKPFADHRVARSTDGLSWVGCR